MQDSNNREIMARLYRLIERYETIPKLENAEEAYQFFGAVWRDSSAALEDFKGNEFAEEFLIAFNEAVGRRYRRQYPGVWEV